MPKKSFLAWWSELSFGILVFCRQKTWSVGCIGVCWVVMNIICGKATAWFRLVVIVQNSSDRSPWTAAVLYTMSMDQEVSGVSSLSVSLWLSLSHRANSVPACLLACLLSESDTHRPYLTTQASAASHFFLQNLTERRFELLGPSAT